MENHKESKFWFTSFIGFFYQLGIGCVLNREKATEYYYLSINFENKYNSNSFNLLSNKNIIIGKYLLSLFYYKDIIIDIEGFNFKKKKPENNNQKELLKLLQLAKNDDSTAQYNLAICYKNGNYIEINHKKSFKWFLISAENGNSDAQYNLAICYMDGIGIQKDKKKAFDWFLKSEQNEYLFCNNKYKKEEFERNLKLAIANGLYAQNYIGYCYQNGKGVNKNKKKAFEWYMKSAENGYAEAQNNLGDCYISGIGTEKDEKKAFKWYLESAENGSADAQNNLGDCYRNGIGTDINENEHLNAI
ncbi:hypothetical protein C1645_28437 [Glomus cerebriforme]|uniref:HCP-like protein n=1 Tax=Glomus cerebriforme TaxID=658196 RepID=A0A397TQH0_9GLOM|nr:hypothetical protein C1645_28437 [Glomus cerebriforme]